MMYRFLEIITRYLLKITFNVKLIADHSLPKSNYIISANHHSWLDSILITLIWPGNADLMYIGPHDVVLNAWWKRWFIGGLHQVALTTERSGWIGKAAYQMVLQGLSAGKCLLIFPEGDIYPQEGALMPFYNGVAYFALKKGLPVVPVGLCGTADLYYRKQLMVHIGAPIEIPLTPHPEKTLINDTLAHIHESTRLLIEGYQDPVVASKPMHWLTHLM